MRRSHLVGLLILLAVLCALILLPTRETTQPDLVDETERSTQQDPTLLTAEGPIHAEEQDPASPAPALRTREPPPKPEVGRDLGPVTVHVVGPAGVGLPDVPVGIVLNKEHVGRFGHAPQPAEGYWRVTDAQGGAVFPNLVRNGSYCAVAYRDDPRTNRHAVIWLLPPAGGHRPAVPIDGDEVTLRVGVGRWLEVQAVKAESGAQVPAVKVKLQHPRALEVDEKGRFLLVTRGEEKTLLHLAIEAPRGRVAWERADWWIQVSPYARSLVAYCPVRREVPLSISVSDEDGSPTERAVLRRVDVAGRRLSKDAFEGDAYGRFHVLGVPLLPGEVVHVAAGREHGVASGSASAWIGGAADADPMVAVVLPLHLAVTVPPEPEHVIGIGGGAGGSFRGRGGRRNPSTGGGTRHTGSLLVTVNRHDGSPAIGALVDIGRHETRTDNRGRAGFPRLAPGAYHVTVQQVGLLRVTGHVTVKAGKQARLDLREPKPAVLHIEVVNEHRRPLPYARLEVQTPSGEPWVDVQNGVQRVDPYTDHRGKRSLRGVEAGTVSVRATWGSRSARYSTELDPGGTHGLHMVLRGPKQPEPVK